MKGSNRIFFLIPILITALFAAANLLHLYRVVDAKIYDFFLRLKPRVEESRSILMLDIDDVAITNVGVFPWSRNIVADGLILMKEFDARYAVFDIEYTELSPRGIDERILQEDLPEAFAREFGRIDTNIADLFGAILNGNIPLEEAEDYIHLLSEETAAAERLLLDRVAEIERDNDDYLGKAAGYFGNAYFTVNMLPNIDPTVGDERRRYAAANISLPRITVDLSALRRVQQAADIKPAILPILRGGAGAGFVNVVVDEDGVRRRIDLVMEQDGDYYPQLALSALLHWLDEPSMKLQKRRFVIEDARMPDGARKTLRVPLAEDGRMLIHWPRVDYLQSFRHLTFWHLVRHDELESRLIDNLKIMGDSGYLGYHRGDADPMEVHAYAESLKSEMMLEGASEDIAEYREARAVFFSELQGFLDGDAEADILADLDRALSSDLQSDERNLYRSIREAVPGVFEATGEIWTELAESRKILAEELRGAFCIIGLTGTSTTDIGVTPMVEEYMNVGTHASLVNTLLNESYLDELPKYASIATALLVSFIGVLLARRLGPLPTIFAGSAALLSVAAATSALFLVSGTYLPALTPLLSVFFTFAVISLMKFLRSEQEKIFLRRAFSHYLSTDVINQLIADPERLTLGGEKKVLTALFTDIRSFTSISESLDPVDLVRLLNAYLTEMSNIILDLNGTIDKYEGDAIISFFGAPVDLADHARRACLAAVRMKTMEQHLNEHFISAELSPSPLLTRIGINSGDMIVGNMGTPQKMDYTVMGSSVNLASRLEGVNKQYGTWILIGEETHKQVEDLFTVRRLDRVRPAGFKEPVRLFELIDEKSSADATISAAVQIFDEGVRNFEAQEWRKALVNFNEVIRALPQDGPSAVYIRRCQAYLKNPPPLSWDGVFNLPMK